MSENTNMNANKEQVPQWFKELLADACKNEVFCKMMMEKYVSAKEFFEPNAIGTFLFNLRVKKSLVKQEPEPEFKCGDCQKERSKEDMMFECDDCQDFTCKTCHTYTEEYGVLCKRCKEDKESEKE